MGEESAVRRRLRAVPRRANLWGCETCTASLPGEHTVHAIAILERGGHETRRGSEVRRGGEEDRRCNRGGGTAVAVMSWMRLWWRTNFLVFFLSLSGVLAGISSLSCVVVTCWLASILASVG